MAEEGGQSRQVRSGEGGQSRYRQMKQGGAYVSVLWGNNPECFLDAMVLGHSLSVSCPKFDRVLLATSDAVACEAAPLLSIFWTV